MKIRYVHCVRISIILFLVYATRYLYQCWCSNFSSCFSQECYLIIWIAKLIFCVLDVLLNDVLKQFSEKKRFIASLIVHVEIIQNFHWIKKVDVRENIFPMIWDALCTCHGHFWLYLYVMWEKCDNFLYNKFIHISYVQ